MQKSPFPSKNAKFLSWIVQKSPFLPENAKPTLDFVQDPAFSPNLDIKKNLARKPSACGGSLLRQNSLPTHGDPRGSFFCHRTHFPMTKKADLFSQPSIYTTHFSNNLLRSFFRSPANAKGRRFTGSVHQSKPPHTPCPSQSVPSALPEKKISAPDVQS